MWSCDSLEGGNANESEKIANACYIMCKWGKQASLISERKLNFPPSSPLHRALWAYENVDSVEGEREAKKAKEKNESIDGKVSILLPSSPLSIVSRTKFGWLGVSLPQKNESKRHLTAKIQTMCRSFRPLSWRLPLTLSEFISFHSECHIAKLSHIVPSTSSVDVATRCVHIFRHEKRQKQWTVRTANNLISRPLRSHKRRSRVQGESKKPHRRLPRLPDSHKLFFLLGGGENVKTFPYRGPSNRMRSVKSRACLFEEALNPENIFCECLPQFYERLESLSSRNKISENLFSFPRSP